MADNVSLKINVDGIGDLFKGMLDRAKVPRGYLNRVAYPVIIKAQQMRWMTEGASEGDGWAPLNPSYAKYKLRKYVDFPGGGRHMLVATNRLADGMMGKNMADHYKLVTDTSVEVGTTIPYAKYVDEKRNITDLSPETISELADGLRDYIVAGKT